VITGTAVSILALFNAIGRIGWGIIGGFLEGKKVILLSLISTSLVCLAAVFAVKDDLTFFLFSSFAGFNYGACPGSLLPPKSPIITEQKKWEQYISTLFLSNGVAGL